MDLLIGTFLLVNMNMKFKKKFDLQVFNTLSRKKEKFVPLKKGVIKMYSCGPTLHKIHTHIGNLWAYTFADFAKRYFQFHGHQVVDVIKFTDVDDHTISECNSSKKELRAYTQNHITDFLRQIALLNITEPEYLPRLTDYINDVVDAISKLDDAKVTYKANDSIYLSINEISNYGELADLGKSKSLKQNAQRRLKEFVDDDKEDINDFCLWKAWRENEGKIFWNTKYGKGRPGWHLGCAVISRKLLGDSFDLHLGGVSHIFPHHTNEIAISETITHKKFVKYWMHQDYVIVDDVAMSPRKGTLYSIDDIIQKGYDPLVLRHLFLKTHYRQKHNFTWQSMDESASEINNIVRFLLWLDSKKGAKQSNKDLQSIQQKYLDNILDGLNDDFNTSESFKALSEFISEIYKLDDLIGKKDAENIKYFIFEVDKIFGFIESSYRKRIEEISSKIDSKEIEKLLLERNQFKIQKEFIEADKIRDHFSSFGLQILDNSNGESYVDLQTA